MDIVRRAVVAAVLTAGLVVVPAALSDGSAAVRDSVGDVKGGPGPDIRGASVSEHANRITFRVVFTKAQPLMFSTKQGFTDMLIVTIWTTEKIGPKQPHYWLGVHAADMRRVALVNALTKKTVWLRPAVVSKKSVIVSLAEHKIGSPRLIRFAVAAGREMNEGSGGGGDRAPDKGTSMPFSL